MKLTVAHVFKQIQIPDEENELRRIDILSDVSVDFLGAKIHTVIGPSGSGKTTLLRMVNKLDSPTKGKILIEDQDIAEIPPRELRKQIGMVFQTPALFRGTITDNVAYGPALFKRKFSETDVKNLLEKVGLKELNPNRNVENLSVGQQQRISFARALANEPRILLLDEPTSALDPTAANNLLDLIRSINQELGICIIMVTHIMEHAKRIADSVCLLVGGKVVETGETRQFFQQPHTEIAQNFIRGEM
ncbi:MAG: phosphate ABC transporter ATP-binding protein [Calditrichaeota bacterium]|nr:phosphate ABC transporter ATP-binding protein [Calditrichota bacterium]